MVVQYNESPVDCFTELFGKLISYNMYRNSFELLIMLVCEWLTVKVQIRDNISFMIVILGCLSTTISR